MDEPNPVHDFARNFHDDLLASLREFLDQDDPQCPFEAGGIRCERFAGHR